MNKKPLYLLWALLSVGTALAQNLAERGPLSVSANQRYLQTADGKPFFWLGDTAWTAI
jgi:hypothetical protein